MKMRWHGAPGKSQTLKMTRDVLQGAVVAGAGAQRKFAPSPCGRVLQLRALAAPSRVQTKKKRLPFISSKSLPHSVRLHDNLSTIHDTKA